MKIAIDIDGTIYDTEKNFRVQGEIYDIEELNKNSVINPTAMWAQDRYNWTKEENEEYLKKFVDISKKSNLIPGAKEVIEKIQKLGIETIIVTARGHESGENNKEMIKIMEEKMKQDGLSFDKYFWGTDDKSKICKQESIDAIIDDSPIVCKQTSSAGIKTVFLHDSGIVGLEPNKNLIEVHNWGEVYREILKIICKK